MSKHLLFVYGTLQKGYGNNRLLHDQKFVGTAITEKKLTLRMRGFPFLSQKEEISQVKGELYEIDNKALERVDRLESHPNWYERGKIEVNIDGKKYDAWTYYNEKENDDSDIVVNGDFRNPILKRA